MRLNAAAGLVFLGRLLNQTLAFVKSVFIEDRAACILALVYFLLSGQIGWPPGSGQSGLKTSDGALSHETFYLGVFD